MPDPHRIDRILATIREAWGKNPDWRLGQLLINAIVPREPCPELFSIEDTKLEKLVVRLSEGKTMTRHVFNVADTFELSGRGMVVVADKRCEELPPWLALKIGDQIEFRSNDYGCLRTRIAGIEMGNPWTPMTPFGFLLPTDLSKTQVPLGCEVWISESSVKKSAENGE
jgi:hypothetical protein